MLTTLEDQTVHLNLSLKKNTLQYERINIFMVPKQNTTATQKRIKMWCALQICRAVETTLAEARCYWYGL